MKELLPSSRSFIRLLSILAFAALGLYYPSESFATVYCKDANPLTPCTRFTGTTCPPATKPDYTTKCSSQGGAGGTGSAWNAAINIGQLGWGMVIDESNDLESLCGGGFFDIEQNSVQASFGTYTPTGGQPQAAQFFFNDWRCSCLAIGTCVGGLRTNISTCPTSEVEGPNLAGCKGRVTVLDLNGNPLRRGDPEFPLSCDGSDTNTDPFGCDIRYGELNGGLDEVSCPTAFPADGGTGLGESQMARVTQVCTLSSNPKNDRFVDVDVRATGSDYQSQTTEFGVLPATCQPGIVDPLACQNNSEIWLSFQAQGEKCVPDTFKCGGAVGGPQPDRCRVRQGKCECRCDRCNENGSTLVNLYSANQGAYVISSSSSGNAYECPLKLEQ